MQDYLEIPVAVENVSSYAEFHESEMTEWEFLNEVVHAADCGILLDVNNIYVSSQNHNFDPMEYVNAVPADRVAQIHIAGHSKFEKYILDTHDHPVLDPVWRSVCPCHRAHRADGDVAGMGRQIPSFEEVHAEALKANRYLLPEKDRRTDSRRWMYEPAGTATPHGGGCDASVDPDFEMQPERSSRRSRRATSSRTTGSPLLTG